MMERERHPKRAWILVPVIVILLLGTLGAFALLRPPSQGPVEPSAEVTHLHPHLSSASEEPLSSGQSETSAAENLVKTIFRALDSNRNDRLDDEEYAEATRLWNSQAPVPGTDNLILDQATFFALTDLWIARMNSKAPTLQDSQMKSEDALANRLLQECATASSKLSCYLERLEQTVVESATERALSVLEEIARVDRDALTAGHPLAHEIGRFSYEHYKDAPTAFAHCRELFDSGCYHGVLEAVLTGTPNLTLQAVGRLCEAAVGTGSSLFVKFQCVHGLGHGLLMHFHEIPEALSYCDALPTAWDQESCYGGVFMEHIVAVNTTNPHHPHRHALKPEDPLYPCNSVERKYQSACYLLQSSAILMLNGYDFEKAFKTCEQAPLSFIWVCYQSMGRDISGFTLRDIDRSNQLCSLGSPPYVPHCLMGVVKDFVNNSGNPEPGFAFCRRVDPAYKDSCYAAVGEMIAALYPDAKSRMDACAQAEATHQKACTAAAGASR